MRSIELGLGVSTTRESEVAVAEVVKSAKATLSVPPALAILSCTVEHDAERVLAAARRELAGVPIAGITTSLGILGGEGVIAGSSGVVAVQLFASPSGTVQFAAGASPIDSSVSGGARLAARSAAERIASQHRGKKPVLLLIMSSPGNEEDVLSGLADVFPSVPAYGGSAADHAIAGQWQTLGEAGVQKSGVTVAAFFGELKFGGAFVAPYEKTSTKAQVTEVVGRDLVTLDGRPAATVLGEWVGESISDQVASGGVVLAQTALSPLALCRVENDIKHFVPTHPFKINQPEGTVSVFALPRPGDQVCLLSGSVESLTNRLEDLVNLALSNGGLSRDAVIGGFLIYCAGCAGAVGGELDDALRHHVGGALGGSKIPRPLHLWRTRLRPRNG
ncbi:MAG: FIST N-terminal domain-containing protein [Polyangiaceae bacterium]